MGYATQGGTYLNLVWESIDFWLLACCEGFGWWSHHYWLPNVKWWSNPLCFEWIRVSGDCCTNPSEGDSMGIWGALLSFGRSWELLATVGGYNLVACSCYELHEQDEIWFAGRSSCWRLLQKQNGLQRSEGQNQGWMQNGSHRDGYDSNNGSSKPNNNSNRCYQPKCQIYDQLGHVAKSCTQLHFSDATVNCATTSMTKEQKWLIDLVASHHITGNIANLSIYSEYDGTDEVTLCDGSVLIVSHIGSLALHSPKQTFILCDTLCIPSLYYFVKDKITGTILLKGTCENGIYTFLKSLVAPS